MPRIFLSHSSRDNPQAVALKRWLEEQDPGLAEEIFLDLDPVTGIAPGERWKEALRQASERCEVVICLLSANWEASRECLTEFRTAENLGKLVLCARLEPDIEGGITREWQRCDLFGNGPVTKTLVSLDGQSRSVEFLTEGLQRLYRGLMKAGIGAEHFAWPPPNDPDRAPYRGWEPLVEADAAVFFGRDGQIVRGQGALRGMRGIGIESLFVVLGPSGSGKSSFLRAGLLPRLRRDERQFLVMEIVRPERSVLTGDRGLAPAIHALRTRLGLGRPTLGEIKAACTAGDAGRLRGWLAEARQMARARLGDIGDRVPPPTVVLPLDQAEELFSVDAGPEAPRFLDLLAGLLHQAQGTAPALIVAGTIRADRYEPWQTAPELAGLKSVVFDELKPMPVARFREVILGPAARATAAGRRLEIEPVLVDRLLEEGTQGADALPLVALTLARLYRDYGGDGDLTLAEYQAMGGMRQVVQHEIDALLSHDPSLREQQLELLHAAFIPWLATINPDNDQPMRRIARRSDLPAESRPLIDAMVEKRLLVRDERDGETVIEVALESLLRQWQELAHWLDTEREDLKEADTLERAAAAWDRSHRNDAWLLEGERLASAETLAAKPGFRTRLNPTRQFLLASRQREKDRAAADKRQQEAELQAAREKQEAAENHAKVLRKRSRVLKTVLAAALVIALVAVLGFVRASLAEREATARTREATALRLTAEAREMLVRARPEGDVRAFQQMIAAHALAKTVEGERALINTVVARRDLVKIIDTASSVWSVAYSPDSRRIASGGGDDHNLRLWDADTGQPIGEPITGHSEIVTCVAFSPDGRRIVSGSADKTVRLWDADTGRAVGEPMIGHGQTPDSVAFSPDGRRIVSAGWDNTVRLWDTQTGQAVGEPMIGHTDAVASVAFSPDGRRIVSGGHDRTVRQWDADSGQPLGEPMTGHTDYITSVAYNPVGPLIVSGGYDGTVRQWAANTGRAFGQPVSVAPNSWVSSVAYSRDGLRIVTGSGDQTLQVWDAATGWAVGEPMIGHAGDVSSVAISPDGRRIASGSNDDGTVRIWNAIVLPPMIRQMGTVLSVAFSPDGHRIVSGSDDGTVRLWDAETGAPIGEPMRPAAGENIVHSVAFSPDGRRIVSGSDSGPLRLWDATTGQPLGEQLTGDASLLSVAFRQDGRLVVSGGSDGAVRLWDADTGQAVGQPMTGHGDRVASVAFSPDGRRIVSGGYDRTMRIWDADTGGAVADPIDAHDSSFVFRVAFSPDGERIVSGGSDGTVRLWEADTGRPLGEPMRPDTGDRSVCSVAFSPDGMRIVSGDTDGAVHLWDAVTGGAIGAPMTGHTDWVCSVAFSPDGGHIVSGSYDGTVRQWPAPAFWPDALCAKITENISHEQWSDWVSPAIDFVEICPGLPFPTDDSAR
jgi:WD40 repeat protein